MPGLSVAEEIRRREPEAVIVFASMGRGMEKQLVQGAGFEFCAVGGPRGGFSLARPSSVSALLTAFLRASGLVRRFRPDVVVGLGGYASVAPVLAARMVGVPALILEQNVFPGRANRFLARWAHGICCQWEESESGFGSKAGRVHVVGNPVRVNILAQRREEALAFFGLLPERTTILVAGGSQGSSWLNRAMVSAAQNVARSAMPLQVLHSAGEADRDEVEAAYARAGVPSRVFAFLNRMDMAYACADLVVSRAGGTAIAEITASGLPAILVPYPRAAGNHQAANARALERRGAAVVIEEAPGAEKLLMQLILQLVGDRGLLKKMSESSRLAAMPAAAEHVVRRIAELAIRRGYKAAGWTN